VLLGIVGGIVLSQVVLARPAAARLSRTGLIGAIIRRGLIYGSVDGMLLIASSPVP